MTSNRSLNRFVLYQISHTTTYTYDQPVVLEHHILRLRPRSSSWQTLQMFSVQVTPMPVGRSDYVDLDGNTYVNVWFSPERTQQLRVQVLSQVMTHETNPFNYLLEPWALNLPIQYPERVRSQLQPYLHTQYPSPILELVQEINHRANSNVVTFLTLLNQRINQDCEYLIRETGHPMTPEETWTQKKGSCRDLTVLFMEVCRVSGLATRFVSGYQEGDPNDPEKHLHAWAEVYLPGAGWRGYDPTLGLVVSDRHIAIAASPYPQDAAPILGHINPSGVRSTMSYQLQIQSL